MATFATIVSVLIGAVILWALSIAVLTMMGVDKATITKNRWGLLLGSLAVLLAIVWMQSTSYQEGVEKGRQMRDNNKL